jgi:hypothetical protein
LDAVFAHLVKKTILQVDGRFIHRNPSKMGFSLNPVRYSTGTTASPLIAPKFP